MSGEQVHPPEDISPACRFFRETFADPGMTAHDLHLVAEHAKECATCAREIGQAINARAKASKQAE